MPHHKATLTPLHLPKPVDLDLPRRVHDGLETALGDLPAAAAILGPGRSVRTEEAVFFGGDMNSPTKRGCLLFLYILPKAYSCFWVDDVNCWLKRGHFEGGSYVWAGETLVT